MSRRQARELALQVLFQVDIGFADPETALFQAFARGVDTDAHGESLTEKEAAFTRDLVQGTWERKAAIDQMIVRHARDWSLDRIAGVDRAILRMAIYEIYHQDDVPESVTADEAVELAKAFSTAESGKFINGILGNVIRSRAQEGAAVRLPTNS